MLARSHKVTRVEHSLHDRSCDTKEASHTCTPVDDVALKEADTWRANSLSPTRGGAKPYTAVIRSATGSSRLAATCAKRIASAAPSECPA